MFEACGRILFGLDWVGLVIVCSFSNGGVASRPSLQAPKATGPEY